MGTNGARTEVQRYTRPGLQGPRNHFHTAQLAAKNKRKTIFKGLELVLDARVDVPRARCRMPAAGPAIWEKPS